MDEFDKKPGGDDAPGISEDTRPAAAARRWDPKGRRNLIIIGGVVASALLLMLVLAVSGGGDKAQEPGKDSAITESNDVQPVPNGMVSEADRAAQAAAEAERVRAAQQSGTSFVSQPVPQSSVVLAPGTVPQGYELPNPNLNPQAVTTRMDTPVPATSGQGMTNGRAEMDEAKVVALSKQMELMMGSWGLAGQANGASGSSYVRQHTAAQARTGGSTSASSGVSDASDEIVIPAHEEAYAAETLGPVDTDTPGKLRARILTGPLAGAVLIGQARRIGTAGVQFDFTGGTFRGTPIKISAYGVDIENSGDVVSGDYHGRYMQRFVFPVLAEGIKAYAGARAQVGTQVIAIQIPGGGADGGGAVTGATQTPAPSAEQARNAMYSAGAGQVAQALKSGPQDGHITLDVKTQFGIVFEQPVYQSDLVAVGRRASK